MSIDKERKDYLKKEKKKRIIILFIQIFIICFIIALWQILSDKNLISSFLFSNPKNIIKTIAKLYKENTLFSHISCTLKEILICFILGSLIAIISAAILWWFPFLSKVLEPYLTILNSLPKIALGPLIIIIGGANQNSIIIMALLISCISTIISIYTGFINTNHISIKLLKSFKANKYQIFTNVILPSNFNIIISSLKINLSMTFVGLLPPVGEKIFFNKCYSRY